MQNEPRPNDLQGVDTPLEIKKSVIKKKGT